MSAPHDDACRRAPTLEYGVAGDGEPADEPSCAFEAFVNVVGTLLVIATVLLLLIDRLRPIFPFKF